MFWITSTGFLSFFDNSLSGIWGFNNVLSTSLVNTGTPTYVAFVRNGLIGTFYINGVAAGTYTSSVSVTYNNSDLVIGKDYRDDVQYYKGYIYYVGIYNVALNLPQIYALYNSGIPLKH